MFATLVNDTDGRLMVSDTKIDLNYKAEQLIAELEPSIKHKWTNHFFSSWYNINKGIHQSFFFNKNNLELFPLEWKEIVKESYQLLTEQGFIVLQDEGLINVDIFDMSSDIPVDTNYTISSSNQIADTSYETCVFYVRKDNTVKGDLEVYQNVPVFFGDGDKTIVPTKSGITILRSGTVHVRPEPHSGFGKEYILSVHFSKISFPTV